jgi:tight adherence protein B
MDILIGVGIFVFVVLLIEGGYFAFRAFRQSEKRALRRRLRTLTFLDYEQGGVDIVRKRIFSEVPWLNRKLVKFRWTERMSLLLEQAGTPHTVGFFVLLSALLVFTGLTVGSYGSWNYLFSLLLAIFLGSLPFLYILLMKKKRMERFEKQLPEALDLVARAMKAGHAFSGALKMVADEMGDPIGGEFEKTLNEINFGMGVAEALKNLASRVDSLDLRFFVISVLIQRETGGNLAEILESISRIIRERFKLHGRIRVLSAEGKLSAIVLIGLPFFVALLLSWVNPEYIAVLVRDPIGRVMALFVFFLMISGIFFMKKMIAIKV